MKTYPCRDGAALSLRILGQGQPVVLLHGLGASSGQWLPFVWPHLKRYRFYMPDLRAMGASAGVSYNQADIFQNHMEDLEDLIAHFGLQDFLLGGHSLGCSVSLHWLNRGGFTDVKRYLHVDQTPCIPNQESWSYGLFGQDQTRVFKRLSELRELIAQHQNCDEIADLPLADRQECLIIIGEAFSRVTGQKIVGKLLPQLASHPKLLARRFPVKRLADLDKLLHSYLNAHDYRPGLSQCATPMRVIVGEHSPIYHPAGQRHIAELAQNAQLDNFPRSGHVPPFQQPFKFFRSFQQFLAPA